MCCLLVSVAIFCACATVSKSVDVNNRIIYSISLYTASRSCLLAGLVTGEHRLPYGSQAYDRNWTVSLNLVYKTLCLTVSAPSPSFNVGGQDSDPALSALHSLSLVPHDISSILFTLYYE